MSIKKILIANRGEIALRIHTTAHKLGISTVAIFSSADKGAAFVKKANQTVELYGEQLSDTYLNIEKIINAAKQTNADAIHPGYGFLSENAAFAKACKNAGLLFIGPDVHSIELMGNKIEARNTAIKAGLPVTPGITGTVSELLNNYSSLSFPLLIKAAAGGGGKGMRIVSNQIDLQEALEATAREAKSYFNDDTIYIEKYIEEPRHIEVQILGDQQGNVVHLYERECSLQRRHQKIIEEAPSASLSQITRNAICNAATSLAKSIGYYSAGTMEFLVDRDTNFYFLEMNTRIQVEHPVTELTTGIDIVEEQIKVAEGKILSFAQSDILQKGHAIECRIYAEDPTNNFLPSPGVVQYYEEPSPLQRIDAPSLVRIDGMEIKSGDTISADFDPMISKLITYASSREEARQLMLSSLQQYYIKGIHTNIEFLAALIQLPDYINNYFSTKYIDQNHNNILSFLQKEKEKTDEAIPMVAALIQYFKNSSSSTNIWQQIGYWRHINIIDVNVNGHLKTVQLVKKDTSSIHFKTNQEDVHASLKHTKGLNYCLEYNSQLHKLSIYQLNLGTFEISYNGFNYVISTISNSTFHNNLFISDDTIELNGKNIKSPMPGKVIKVNIQKGDHVQKGDTLLIVEAMKMENNIISPTEGVVEELNVKVNDKVDTNKCLVTITAQ